MTKLFIIRNQNGQYLSKQQEWLDGGDRNALYRTVHRDEAINTVFEVSSRDIYLRAEALACDADARGNPLLGDSAVPARDSRDSDADPDTADTADTADQGAAVSSERPVDTSADTDTDAEADAPLDATTAPDESVT